MTEETTITVKSILNGYVVIGIMGEHYCPNWEEMIKYVEREIKEGLT